MKIPKDIEYFNYLANSDECLERMNKMIDAINFILERARKEDVENTPFAMNSEETIKALDWVKADSIRKFTEWVIDKISEFGWIDDMPASRLRELAEEFLEQKKG